MDKNEIRDRILRTLYADFLENEDVCMTEEELAKAVRVSKKEIKKNGRFLSDVGFVEELSGCAYDITQKGRIYADGPGPFNPDYKQVAVELNVGEGGVVQAGAIGGNASHINQHLDMTPESALAFFRDIVQASSLPSQQKQKLLSRIVDMVKEHGPQVALQSLISRLFDDLCQ